MKKIARKCSTCGTGMNEGFFDAGEYSCSEKCLLESNNKNSLAKYTMDDWETDCYKHEECYYTEWDDENDYQYVEINGEVKDLLDLEVEYHAMTIFLPNGKTDLIIGETVIEGHFDKDDGKTYTNKSISNIVSMRKDEETQNYISKHYQELFKALISSTVRPKVFIPNN